MTHNTLTALLTAAALMLSCTSCTPSAEGGSDQDPSGETVITLSDDGVQVDGADASTDPASAVYVGGEIIYYRDGTDETYGEGSQEEQHSEQEAAAHTVVTITQPGTYRVSGKLSQSQLFVDLGEGAEDDPEAVVTLILDGVDITCTVAPAVFFYRVYECASQDLSDAGPTVDTSAAGANVILAADSENLVSGSHVARIYQEGTTDKLHKYDGAFYSRMSMNVDGEGEDDSGVLRITADNEGLNSELHLTVNGGTIYIQSQDDGINTNEDGLSVFTLNGGFLTVEGGLGTEGDGIDSNGYLTINGGTLWTMSNERSADGGLDADEAITINGGTVYAFGTRNDAVDSSSAQPYLELSFASTLEDDSVVMVIDQEGETLFEAVCQKSCQSITLSSEALALDTTYFVYVDGVQQCYTGNLSGMAGDGGGQPGGGTPPGGAGPGQEGESPEGAEPGESGEPLEGAEPGENSEPPEGAEPGESGAPPRALIQASAAGQGAPSRVAGRRRTASPTGRPRLSSRSRPNLSPGSGTQPIPERPRSPLL